MDHEKIYTVMITGGPCGGKTSSIPKIKQNLERFGIKVVTPPEVPTIIYSNGAEWNSLDENKQRESVKVSIKLQESMEDSFFRFAELSPKKPAVVLIDRGLLDNEPFLSRRNWNMVMKHCGYSYLGIKARYDQVIHMHSVAVDKPELYNTTNNIARRENVVEAAEKDYQTLQAYIGHPRLFTLDNSTDLETKIERATGTVLDLFGIAPLERPVQKHRMLIAHKNAEGFKQKMERLKEKNETDCDLITTHDEWFYSFQFPKGKMVDVISERTKLSASPKAESTTSTSSSNGLTKNSSFDMDPFIELVSSPSEGAEIYYLQDDPQLKKRKISAERYEDLKKQASNNPTITRRIRYFSHANQQYQLIDFNYGQVQVLELHADKAEMEVPPFILKNQEVTISSMDEHKYNKLVNWTMHNKE